MKGLTESGERSVFTAMRVSLQRSAALASFGLKHRTNCEFKPKVCMRIREGCVGVRGRSVCTEG